MKMLKVLNLKAILLKAMAEQRSHVDDPLQKFNFRVIFTDVQGTEYPIGFQKVSGLNEEIGVTEYDEGGRTTTKKLPGKKKIGEVTMEKGEYAVSIPGTELTLHDLMEDVTSNSNFRQEIMVERLTTYNVVARRYTLDQAWVSKWEGSDSDAASADVAIEKITVQCEDIKHSDPFPDGEQTRIDG